MVSDTMIFRVVVWFWWFLEGAKMTKRDAVKLVVAVLQIVIAVCYFSSLIWG